MIEFFQTILHNPLLLNPLIAGVLASLACGVIGTYVVTRRITYLAGGIAHCVLGGMGCARYMQVVHKWTFFDPLVGALIAALTAAQVGLDIWMNFTFHYCLYRKRLYFLSRYPRA